jgi:beta-lactamase class A
LVTAEVVTPTSPPAPTEPLPTATPFAPPDLRYLATELDAALEPFTGLSSYTVIDLRSGQRIARNPDVAIAGASLLKIPIILDVYRVLDRPPDVAQRRLIVETTTLSGNFTANLLLEVIAGQPDAYAGALALTNDLRQIGLYNTFMAVPYDKEPVAAYPTTYFTPANQQQALTTNPDPYRQTTTSDLAALLQMIDECRQNRGLLLETFADSLMPAECAQTLKEFEANRINAFVELGTPPEATLAHKHGWVNDTHGDAAIVYSPGGDYALAVALYQPGWLEWEVSNPLIGELARLTYAHFNDPGAYTAAQLAAPLPTLIVPSPTPDLPQARVANTHGAGLTLRESPAGAEIAVLPEGMILYLLPEQPVLLGVVTWQRVMAATGEIGWVGMDFVMTEE